MAEEEKTVDLDTSGPGAEVELPVEESKNEQQTEKTNEDQVETKIEDGASTDDTSAKSDEHSDVQEETVEETKEQKDKRFSEDEIKKYGFNVKRRIGREVAKRREAERQRDEVSEYTKLIMAERDKLKSRLEKLDTNYVSEVETRIKSGVEAAQIKLAKAREENDIKSEVEAQKEISRLGFEEARLNELKTSQAKKEQIMQQPQEEAIAPQQRPPIDEKTQEWIDTNKSWFGKVKGMTATAYDIHDDLMNEGYEGSSDDYFSELDRRLRVEFPNKFDKVDEPTTEKAKPAQTVASAKRPAATGRNKTVSLTPTEVAIARRIGVSLEDYAREKYAKEGRSI